MLTPIVLIAAAALASPPSGPSKPTPTGASSPAAAPAPTATATTTTTTKGADGRPNTPDEALASLKTGNTRFATGKVRAPRRDPARVRETALGQTPFATVITCADSRLPAEMIFDQGVGDLFVVRVAGNVCDTDEIGTAEYGVGHLHTPLLVVMGHTSCGAVKAVCENARVGGSIPALVDNIAPAVERARATGATGDALIREAVTQNVWQSIADLLTGSEEIRAEVAQDKLTVVGAVYDIGTGRVEFLGEHPAQSGLLAKAPAEAHPAASAFVPTGDLRSNPPEAHPHE